MSRPRFKLSEALLVLGICTAAAISCRSANQDPAANAPTQPSPNNLTRSPRPQPTPTPSPTPEYSWTPGASESFILPAGGFTTYPVTSSFPHDPLKAHYVRFEVKSSAGVDAGVLEADFSQNIANWFGSPLTLCYTPVTLESKHICRLAGMHTAALIVLRDPRPTGEKAALGLIAAAMLGVKEPAHKLAQDNRVTLTFYEWQCINNCKSLPQTVILWFDKFCSGKDD